MDMDLPDNPDLAWDLEHFNHRERAKEFVMQFESSMCVYSASVQQIYTSFNMFFPREWDSKLVILPDETAYHDTFFHIDPKAVVATGLYIVPGELVGRQGLHLANVDENRALGPRQFHLEPALRAIMKNRPEKDPFLPLLTKGDLREFEQSWPVMHMHRVKPGALTEISHLDRTSISSVICEKLHTLLQARANVA